MKFQYVTKWHILQREHWTWFFPPSHIVIYDISFRKQWEKKGKNNIPRLHIPFPVFFSRITSYYGLRSFAYFLRFISWNYSWFLLTFLKFKGPGEKGKNYFEKQEFGIVLKIFYRLSSNIFLSILICTVISWQIHITPEKLIFFIGVNTYQSPVSTQKTATLKSLGVSLKNTRR